MSKKKFLKGIESIEKQISLHRNIILQEALDEGNEELAG